MTNKKRSMKCHINLFQSSIIDVLSTCCPVLGDKCDASVCPCLVIKCSVFNIGILGASAGIFVKNKQSY